MEEDKRVKMRIAYIITAYIDAPQLRRLIDALCLDPLQGKTDFYVHIDKKVDIRPFKRAMERCSSDVCWCKRRYRINWGGFNQVWSQFELLRMIFEESKQEYDRIICLSGTDYPLVSNTKIVETFQSYPDIEYIGGFNLTRCNDNAQVRKVRDYHFFRDIPLPLSLKRLLCGGTRLLFRYLPIRKNLIVIGSNGLRYEIYTGSDYWALTYNTAKIVFETMRDDKKLMSYFRTSYIPSEGVINTIVFNLVGKRKCSHYSDALVYPGLEALTPLHYLHYDGAIKIYTADDFEELSRSDKMFFRKAKTGYSDILINQIENDLRKK